MKNLFFFWSPWAKSGINSLGLLIVNESFKSSAVLPEQFKQWHYIKLTVLSAVQFQPEALAVFESLNITIEMSFGRF